MSEEQQQAAPSHAPAPAAPSQSPAKKGSRTCLIVAIIILVLALLGACGIYIGYRYVKSKINISSNDDSSSLKIRDTEVNTTNNRDSYDYNDIKSQTPNNALLKTTNSEIEAILQKLYGGSKLRTWASIDTKSGSLDYITKNTISSKSFVSLENEIKNIGYTDTQNYSSQDNTFINGKKNNITISISSDISVHNNEIMITVVEDTQ